MMICRCAWHPRYQGYPRWIGIASWRGLDVRFTDGICARCLERFRAEHRTFFERRHAAVADAAPAPAPQVA
jgi:hypothetical protein